MKNNYGYKKETKLPFLQTVEKVKEELKKEGFGILTEINVKETLKKKLGVEYDNYIILGACNPPFAYRALQAEKEIGLLLPCNIIVYSNKDKIVVSAILPTIAMARVNNPALKEIAFSIEQKLKIVVDRV
jgi:uncharacterized protein (DUF302 family)